MSRTDTIVRLGAALLGIVAVAIAASNVHSTVETGGEGDGDGSAPADPTPPPEETAEPGSVPAIVEYLPFVVVAVLAVVVAWYLVFHRRELLRALAVWLAIGLTVIGLLVLLNYLGGNGDVPVPEEEMPVGQEPEEEADGDGETVSTAPLVPFFVILATMVLIFVVTLIRTRNPRDFVGELAEPEPDSDVQETAAVGAAAGRAAERIESGGAETDRIENEIYRAWHEMTRLLDVDRPASATPREFADAAVDAGIDRPHVDELTNLFETVRYGHAETTDDRAGRAVEVLRRIETTYGSDERSANEGERPVAEGDRQ